MPRWLTGPCWWWRWAELALCGVAGLMGDWWMAALFAVAIVFEVIGDYVDERRGLWP